MSRTAQPVEESFCSQRPRQVPQTKHMCSCCSDGARRSTWSQPGNGVLGRGGWRPGGGMDGLEMGLNPFILMHLYFDIISSSRTKGKCRASSQSNQREKSWGQQVTISSWPSRPETPVMAMRAQEPFPVQQKKLFWEVCKFLGPWCLPGQGCGRSPRCAVSEHHERHPTSRDSLTHPSNSTFCLPFCHWGKEVCGVGVDCTHGGFIQVGVPLWPPS